MAANIFLCFILLLKVFLQLYFVFDFGEVELSNCQLFLAVDEM